MRSIAIGAIVLGNLAGAGVTGCIFGDGGGGSGTTIVCTAICDCFGAQIGPNCQAQCEADPDFANPTPACVTCVMDNANDCTMLDAQCEAPCDPGPPQPTTLVQACQIVCTCSGNPVDCQAQCEAAYAVFPQACYDCVGAEQCNADTLCTTECQ